MNFKYLIEPFNASEGLLTQKAQRLIEDNEGIGQIPLRTRQSIPPHLQDNGSDYDLQLSYTLPDSLDSFDPSDLLNPLDRNKRLRHPQRLISLPKNFSPLHTGPLTDFFETGTTIILLCDMRGVDRNSFHLNVLPGKIEVRSNDFHIIKKLPSEKVAIEKSFWTYQNGLLKVVIPKKHCSPVDHQHIISID